MFSINNTISRNPVMSQSEDRVSGQQNPAATGTNSACAQGLAGHVKAVSSTRVISFPAEELAAADEMSREVLQHEPLFLSNRKIIRRVRAESDARDATTGDIISMYVELANKPEKDVERALYKTKIRAASRKSLFEKMTSPNFKARPGIEFEKLFTKVMALELYQAPPAS